MGLSALSKRIKKEMELAALSKRIKEMELAAL